MPSAATVTAFYSFSPNTKARAARLLSNFDLWRGHIIPITTDTATASTNTYDLGSSTYRWRSLYVSGVDFRSSTIAADISIYGDTSDTKGAFVVKGEGGAEMVRFGRDTYSSNIPTTTGEYYFQVSGSNVLKATYDGVPRDFFFTRSNWTTSAISPFMARSAMIYPTISSYSKASGVTTAITSSTITVTTLNGNPIHIILTTDATSTSVSNTPFCWIEHQANATVASAIDVLLRRDGTTICRWPMRRKCNSGTAHSELGTPSWWFVDEVSTVGSYNYDIAVLTQESCFFNLVKLRLVAWEIT